jgi:hypothetical protein
LNKVIVRNETVVMPDLENSPELQQQHQPAINWRYQVAAIVPATSGAAVRPHAPARTINWRYQTPAMSDLDIASLPADVYIEPRVINWRYQTAAERDLN